MNAKVKSGKMEEHTNMPNANETGEQPKRRAVTAESMATLPEITIGPPKKTA